MRGGPDLRPGQFGRVASRCCPRLMCTSGSAWCTARSSRVPRIGPRMSRLTAAGRSRSMRGPGYASCRAKPPPSADVTSACQKGKKPFKTGFPSVRARWDRSLLTRRGLEFGFADGEGAAFCVADAPEARRASGLFVPRFWHAAGVITGGAPGVVGRSETGRAAGARVRRCDVTPYPAAVGPGPRPVIRSLRPAPRGGEKAPGALRASENGACNVSRP
jgi:hypothetical protein